MLIGSEFFIFDSVCKTFCNPLKRPSLRNEFRCRKCSYNVSGKAILILMDRLFDELEMLDPNSIKDYEDYLKRYANVLHQNHYLILSAKHSLCQLIGRSDGFIINKLDISQLQRKEEYCRDLLNVVNVLEPGASRLRGIICYEVIFNVFFFLNLFNSFYCEKRCTLQ